MRNRILSGDTVCPRLRAPLNVIAFTVCRIPTISTDKAVSLATAASPFTHHPKRKSSYVYRRGILEGFVENFFARILRGLDSLGVQSRSKWQSILSVSRQLEQYLLTGVTHSEESKSGASGGGKRRNARRKETPRRVSGHGELAALTESLQALLEGDEHVSHPHQQQPDRHTRGRAAIGRARALPAATTRWLRATRRSTRERRDAFQ